MKKLIINIGLILFIIFFTIYQTLDQCELFNYFYNNPFEDKIFLTEPILCIISMFYRIGFILFVINNFTDRNRKFSKNFFIISQIISVSASIILTFFYFIYYDEVIFGLYTFFIQLIQIIWTIAMIRSFENPKSKLLLLMMTILDIVILCQIIMDLSYLLNYIALMLIYSYISIYLYRVIS